MNEGAGYKDSTGTGARFAFPTGVAVDKAGNVYVAEFGGHRLRKITPAGVVSTIAGNGTPGFVQGTSTTAQFNKPAGVAIDKDGTLFIAEVAKNIRANRLVTLFQCYFPFDRNVHLNEKPNSSSRCYRKSG